MNRRLFNFLHGFHSYEFSFNLRVLADDQDIKKTYTEATERGRLPFNRSKILILGDHGVGKTSTCRRLQGKSFRSDEPSTLGISTNSVTADVTDVNSKWHEVSTTTTAEDFESSAAWWTALHMRKETTIQSPNATSYSVLEMAKRFLLILPIFLACLLIGLNFGFGVIVWVIIICLIPFHDFHSAYRIGSGMGIGLMLIIFYNTNHYDDELFTEKYKQPLVTETGVELFKIILKLVLYMIFCYVTSFVSGCGCRIGMCIALCLVVRPGQKELSYEIIRGKINWLLEDIHMIFFFWVVSLWSLAVLRQFSGKISKLSKIKGLCIGELLVCLVALGVNKGVHSTFVLEAILLVVLISFTLAGALNGRNITAYKHFPQNYFLKKSTGFVYGIFMVKYLGYEFADIRSLVNFQSASVWWDLIQMLKFVLPIIFFIVYETVSYKKVRNTDSVSLKYLGKAFKAIFRKEQYLDARLSLWDFAGQEMYYTTHHLFMPKQGVYLIVFNAVEAMKKPAEQIKRLNFWLQSISMHADVENTVVFLVGTKRSVCDIVDLSNFSDLVKQHLYERFSVLIKFNPTTGNIIFFVENALEFDKERNALREIIYNEIKEMKYFKQKFSVKYLRFKESLNSFRLENSFIKKLDDISIEANSTCKIMTENELRTFLNFFDRAGDIVYKQYDEELRNYVICDPQVLIDVFQNLVNVPADHKKERRVSKFWKKIEEKGIVNSKLLEYICTELGIWDIYPLVIRFLVGTQLLFPISVTNEIDQVGTFYLPCRLPKVHLLSNIWNSKDAVQDIYYFDFGGLVTEQIFLRLVAKCCGGFSLDNNNLYYDAARFRTNKSCLFFISTHVIPGTAVSFDRTFIKFAMHNEDQTHVLQVLQKVITFTKDIIHRDFNPDYFQEPYKCGPVCEKCSGTEGTMCLVNILTRTHDFDVATLNDYRPDPYHKFSIETKLRFHCSRDNDEGNSEER